MRDHTFIERKSYILPFTDKNMAHNKGLIRESYSYFKIRKNYFLIPVITLLLILSSITAVFALPSQSDFTKCRNLTIITSPSSIQETPLWARIDYDSDMATDFSDIAIFDKGCGDNSSVPLNFEIDTKLDSSHANLWIRNNWSLNSDVISVYYGNSTMTSLSDAASTWSDVDGVFHFTDNDTTSTGSSYRGDNITLVNNPSLNMSRLGNAMIFDSNLQQSGEVADQPYFTPYAGEGFTALIFFEPSSSPSGGYQEIFTKDSGQREWSIMNRGDVDRMEFYLFEDGGTNAYSLLQGDNAVLGSYHSAAAVWDGNGFNTTNMALYVDGENDPFYVEDFSTIPNITDTTTPLYFATNINNNRWYNGMIDEARFYRRVLTADEIERFSKEGNQSYYSLGSEQNVNGTVIIEPEPEPEPTPAPSSPIYESMEGAGAGLAAFMNFVIGPLASIALILAFIAAIAFIVWGIVNMLRTTILKGFKK